MIKTIPPTISARSNQSRVFFNRTQKNWSAFAVVAAAWLLLGAIPETGLAADAVAPATAAVTWVPVPLPAPPRQHQVLLPAARDVNAPGGLPARKLFDYGTRDPMIRRGPDGFYYMVATAAANSLPAPLKSMAGANFWELNDGIPLWRSQDLVHWETCGYVWTFEKDATWAKAYTEHDGKKQRAIWAPEINFFKGTYWITYSHNWGGTGVLKSTSGQPEGPYVDIKTDGALTPGIDSSLFADDDGQVYLLESGYYIARLKPDMTGLAEPLRLLEFSPPPPWGEGINMQKTNGLYVWSNAGTTKFPWQGSTATTYDCFAATSTNIYGPYTNYYRAIPYGGHNNLFQGPQGNWFSTLFSSSPGFDWEMKPGIVPIELSAEGIISVKRTHPRPIWRYTTAAPDGDWQADGFDDQAWQTGAGGFGDLAIMNAGPVADVGTVWKSGPLWLRQTFELAAASDAPELFIRHTGPVRVWVDGREIYQSDAAMEDYAIQPLAGVKLTPGKHVIAVQNGASTTQPFVDLGLIENH
jgi:hypothetical protein